MRRWLLLLACALGGCALTSKGTPLEVRWYTPEPVRAPSAPAHPAGPALHLGYVGSGTDLGERIAWSDGAYQVGFYDDRRWTERPATYVTDALRRALLQQGFQPALQAGAPTLEVELVAFQEIRSPRAHAARVALHVQLRTDRVLLDETISKETAVSGARFDDVVAAIAQALNAAAAEVAKRAASALGPEASGTGASAAPPAQRQGAPQDDEVPGVDL